MRQQCSSQVLQPDCALITLSAGGPSWLARTGSWIAVGTFGRSTLRRDFQRQYIREPFRCQRSSVSGQTMIAPPNSDGNSR